MTDTATGKKTLYVYDADGNRLAVKQADGSVALMVGNTEFTASAAGTVTFSRTYSVGGEAVAIRDNTGIDTVVTDHHATPVVLIDGATANVTRRRYSPFGEQFGSAPGWPSDREFLGKIADPTGYSHVEAREYDPALGRFLSVDSVGFVWRAGVEHRGTLATIGAVGNCLTPGVNVIGCGSVTAVALVVRSQQEMAEGGSVKSVAVDTALTVATLGVGAAASTGLRSAVKEGVLPRGIEPQLQGLWTVPEAAAIATDSDEGESSEPWTSNWGYE